MRINGHRGIVYRPQGRIETAGGELKHRYNLFPRHIEPLHDFFNRRPRLKIFENRSDRHPGIPENPGAMPAIWHALHGGTL
jgi:hypothetical protein